MPRGEIFNFTFDNSTVYPGTVRKIAVYVPAQYTADKPACVYVGLDGLAFDAPTVFDNLIASREMPVTIAIGIDPGRVESGEPQHNPRFNRSVEFDALDDSLARLLLDEVFPEVERQRIASGVRITLSKDPNDRAAGGMSTGGIGAFTLAWERPDAFRRVFTAIGTFVGMRGGDRYAVLVRKTEPKPIRIFMQDGSRDQLTDIIGEAGDWWLNNQTMHSALKFAGYPVNQVWGEGSHDAKHAVAVFPDAMRWLWEGWPAPVTAGISQNVFLKEILIAGEGWHAVPTEDPVTQTLVGDGRGYVAESSDGRVYRTQTRSGSVWMHGQHGEEKLLDKGLDEPTGIALSPDGLWLAVSESKTHWGYSYRVLSDGTVCDKQKFYQFCVPDAADDSGAGGSVMDSDGRLYVATRMGVQVFDRNGRLRALIPTPGGRTWNLQFDANHLEILCVLCADGRAYRRKLKARGVASGSSPIVLPLGFAV